MSMVIDGVTYYTLREVADAAGRSKQTIKRWADEGKIPRPKRLESNGWLIYSQSDRDEIAAFAKRIVPH